MATSDNSNQTVGSQSTSNSSTGNGNFSFSDGKWQSTDGSSLDGSGGFVALLAVVILSLPLSVVATHPQPVK